MWLWELKTIFCVLATKTKEVYPTFILTPVLRNQTLEAKATVNIAIDRLLAAKNLAYVNAKYIVRKNKNRVSRLKGKYTHLKCSKNSLFKSSLLY